MCARETAEGGGTEVFTGDMHLFDERGRCVLAIDGLHLKSVPAEVIERLGEREPGGGQLNEIDWSPELGGAGEDGLADDGFSQVTPGPWRRRWLDASGRCRRHGTQGATHELSCGVSEPRTQRSGVSGYLDACPLTPLRCVRGSESQFVRGIVFLAGPADSCKELLDLVQAVGRSSGTLRLWIVTCGAQAVGKEALLEAGVRERRYGVWARSSLRNSRPCRSRCSTSIRPPQRKGKLIVSAPLCWKCVQARRLFVRANGLRLRAARR